MSHGVRLLEQACFHSMDARSPRAPLPWLLDYAKVRARREDGDAEVPVISAHR
jgi:hypothetical protein